MIWLIRMSSGRRKSPPVIAEGSVVLDTEHPAVTLENKPSMKLPGQLSLLSSVGW